MADKKKKPKKKQKTLKLGGMAGKAQDTLAGRAEKLKRDLCKSTGDC